MIERLGRIEAGPSAVELDVPGNGMIKECLGTEFVSLPRRRLNTR